MTRLLFDLRDALQDYEARTGIRLTYEALSERCGLSVDTIKSMATRNDYNTTLKVISVIGEALQCNPMNHLQWVEN